MFHGEPDLAFVDLCATSPDRKQVANTPAFTARADAFIRAEIKRSAMASRNVGDYCDLNGFMVIATGVAARFGKNPNLARSWSRRFAEDRRPFPPTDKERNFNVLLEDQIKTRTNITILKQKTQCHAVRFRDFRIVLRNTLIVAIKSPQKTGLKAPSPKNYAWFQPVVCFFARMPCGESATSATQTQTGRQLVG